MLWPKIVYTTQSRLLKTLEKKVFKNIAGKGENAGTQHFLHLPQSFLFIPYRTSIFESHLFCCQQMLLIWSRSKIVSIGKKLKRLHAEVDAGNCTEPKGVNSGQPVLPSQANMGLRFFEIQ